MMRVLGFACLLFAVVTPAFAQSGSGGPLGQKNCPVMAAPPDRIAGMEAYVYRTLAGRDLRIHVARPLPDTGNGAGVLLFFGGGWRIGNIHDFAERANALAQKGYAVAVADYRILCRDGTGPIEALEDAGSAFSWFRRHADRFGMDARRIVLGGGSAGGQLALVTALRAGEAERPVGLLLYNPVVHLGAFRETFGLSDRQIRELSPVNYGLADLPRTMIFHGSDDKVVTMQSVRDFCRKAREGGAECHVEEYEHQDHGFFHSKVVDPVIGTSPFEDTLAKSLRFLTPVGAPGRSTPMAPQPVNDPIWKLPREGMPFFMKYQFFQPPHRSIRSGRRYVSSDMSV